MTGTTTAPQIRSARTRAMQVFEFVLPPNFRVPAHGHAPPHLLLILDGSIVEGAAGKLATCNAGDVRYSPGGDEHVVQVLDAGARCLIIEAAGFAESRGTERMYLMSGAATSIMEEVRRELYDVEYASPFRAEELVLQLFATMQRVARGRQDSEPGWLTALSQELMRSAALPPTLAQLAVDAGRHPNFVARAFRARFGVSLGRFRRRRQLHRTWQLLADPALSLSDVAARSEFTDQSHMTRVVLRELLETPERVRQRLARPANAGEPRGNWFQSFEPRTIG